MGVFQFVIVYFLRTMLSFIIDIPVGIFCIGAAVWLMKISRKGNEKDIVKNYLQEKAGK